MKYLYLAVAPYLDKSGGRLYKIGITKSPEGRMKSLSSSGVCGEFRLLFHREVYSGVKCERSVFETLKYFRYKSNREIFSFVSNEEAILAVSEAVLYHQEGSEVSSKVRLPDELLNQLEDRWYDEECVV